MQVFLTSALVGGECSASCPGRFTPGERAPDIHWIGGWVGPRTGLDDMKKILAPTGTRTPTPSAVQPVASRFTELPTWTAMGYLPSDPFSSTCLPRVFLLGTHNRQFSKLKLKYFCTQML
jgi:hypothetical protein